MSSILFYVICFISGIGGALIFVKSGKTLKHRQEVKQLQTDKADLAQVIIENQHDIKELKTDVAELSSQVIQCLEILASVTRIREKIEDINARIVVTQRFSQKYERFLLGSEFNDKIKSDPRLK